MAEIFAPTIFQGLALKAYFRRLFTAIDSRITRDSLGIHTGKRISKSGLALTVGAREGVSL